MIKTRDFHLGDVLSVTTNRLVSPRHMTGLCDILNFMTGEGLATHQLPRAADEMRPRLLARHPALASVEASGVDGHNWREWLDGQVARFGETLPVRPEHQFHEVKDPLQEAVDMAGPGRVIEARTGKRSEER